MLGLLKKQWIGKFDLIRSVANLSWSTAGGILSALLFCIYINDLADILLSFSMSEVDTTVSILERDLRSVATWCCKNQLLINPDKTKFIIIGTRQL